MALTVARQAVPLLLLTGMRGCGAVDGYVDGIPSGRSFWVGFGYICRNGINITTRPPYDKAALLSATKKQMTGIEPASSAWEADVLPMNYICVPLDYTI